MKDMLKCPECGSVLELSVGFTGCDWNCEAGEGSNFDNELSLNCTNDDCARVFTLCHLKNEYDFSPVIDKLKSYKYR